MINNILAKLKLFIKLTINKGIYCYLYIKALFKDVKNKKVKTKKKYKTTFFEIIFNIIEKWKIVSFFVICFVILYYGIGAMISSKINNDLDDKIIISSKSNHLNSSIIHILKQQVDENQWTPALPIIFPASILDNLPNFQIGAKDGVKFFIKQMSNRLNNENLANAYKLLDYPENIWLFSKIDDENIAPGSAKQYRKALTNITKFNNEVILNEYTKEDFLYYCNALNLLLKSRTKKLQNHIVENNSKTIDLRSDDLFYQTKGYIYSIYYILSAISKDYQNLIVQTNQYDNIVFTLDALEKSSDISPMVIKNSSLENSYSSKFSKELDQASLKVID